MLTYSIIWRNPYTDPPNNYPRQLWRGEKGSGFIQAFFGIVGYGAGWCVSVAHIADKPKVKWSNEAKGRNRRRRLKQRLQKKYPLFWQPFYEQDLAERPEYYNGEDPE